MALAFKLEEGKFGQLTYMRLYSGTLRKGEFIVNTTNGKRIKVPHYSPVVRLPAWLISLPHAAVSPHHAASRSTAVPPRGSAPDLS